MKKTYLLILIFSICANAQKIRGFGSIASFYDRKFEQNIFVAADAGLEIKLSKKFRPEIGFSAYYGSLRDQNTLNNFDEITNLLSQNFLAIGLTIRPKFCLAGSETDGDVLFQMFPIYSITNVRAKGNFYTYDLSNNNKTINEQDTFSETRQSIGVGFGVFIDFVNKNDSMALNLIFNNINFGNALSKLKFANNPIATNNVIGLELKYYFGFSGNKKK